MYLPKIKNSFAKLTAPALLTVAVYPFCSYAEEVVTAEDRVKNNLERIFKLDSRYNAVIATDELGALQAAKNIDQMSPQQRSALLVPGMTILLKDNIESVEHPTTAGSMALADNNTNKDANLVANLRQQGAIILGKANLSEWANFRSEKSISGWSAVGGQTRNAIDPSRSACGSSSGSAAAVALGYSQVAIGTETDGSIVCPASVNGVVGIKPTHGLISGDGIVPLASTQDTAGPMARTVQDAALALSAMIDGNSNQDTHQRLKAELAQPLSGESDLAGKRIGILSHVNGYDIRRDRLQDNAVETLKKAGAEIVPGLSFSPYEEFWEDVYSVLLYEFKHDLNQYLAGLPNSLNDLTLAKVIQFNEEHAGRELKYFDQSIFIKSEELQLTENEYREKLARLKQATRDQGIDKLMQEHNLDALIGITTGPAWKIDNVNGDSLFGPGLSSYPAIGGHPHITVPMGTISSLPIGLSFIGKRFEDSDLARIAHQFEVHH